LGALLREKFREIGQLARAPTLAISKTVVQTRRGLIWVKKQRAGHDIHHRFASGKVACVEVEPVLTSKPQKAARFGAGEASFPS
jgi:hypothetical protein